MSDDPTILRLLATMEDRANERHADLKDDLADVKDQVRGLNNRVVVLERVDNRRAGARDTTARLWAAGLALLAVAVNLPAAIVIVVKGGL